MRINYADEKLLVYTVGKKLSDKDLDKGNIANYFGCLKDKAMRHEISRKNSLKESIVSHLFLEKLKLVTNTCFTQLELALVKAIDLLL